MISLAKIAFPIKTWRTQMHDPVKPEEGGGTHNVPVKRARSSVQVVTGWAELDWTAVLFGGMKRHCPGEKI